MKKLSAFLLAFSLFLTLLAGCTGDSGTAGSTSGTSSASQAGTGTANTTLVFWSIGLKLKDDSGIKTQEELASWRFIRKFEEDHPGVKIEVIDQPVDGIHELFKAANLSGDGPDVIGLWSGSATNEYQDYLLPLDSYLSEEDINSFTGLDVCRVDFKPDGEIIALPYNLTTYNVFYNKELFAKAGVTEDMLPTTWPELLKLCETLKAAGVQPMLVGDSSGESSTWVTSEFLVDLAGPEKIVEFGTDAFPYDSPEFTQSLTAWTELFNKDYTNKDFASLGAWDSIQRFVVGEGAMNINGSWAIGEMYPIMGDNLGTFKIPAITADAPFGEYIVSQPGANVSVTSYSKNPDLAVAFIKHMTSADFQGQAHLDTGDLPANNQVDASIINNPISKISFGWVQENKTGMGFDSIVPIEVATEFYKLGPTLANGSLSPEDMIAKLMSLQ